MFTAIIGILGVDFPEVNVKEIVPYGAIIFLASVAQLIHVRVILGRRLKFKPGIKLYISELVRRVVFFIAIIFISQVAIAFFGVATAATSFIIATLFFALKVVLEYSITRRELL